MLARGSLLAAENAGISHDIESRQVVAMVLVNLYNCASYSYVRHLQEPRS
jgi:hypothetical protein